MAFIVHCPHCRQPMTADDSMLGKVMSCPRCKQRLRVSKPAVTAKAPRADASVPLKVLCIALVLFVLAAVLGAIDLGGVPRSLQGVVELVAAGLGYWSLGLLTCLVVKVVAARIGTKHGRYIAAGIAFFIGYAVALGGEPEDASLSSNWLALLRGGIYGGVTLAFWTISGLIWKGPGSRSRERPRSKPRQRPPLAGERERREPRAPQAEQTQTSQGTQPQKKRRIHGCLLAFLIALALLVVGLPLGFYIAGQALMDYVSESVAKSPLYLAVAAGNIQEVDRLLAEGANPDEKAIMGHSPLIMAARSDYPLIAERLLNARADPNQRDSLDWAPLHHAVKTDSASLDIISILVRHGADVDVTDSHLRTPLHRAAQFGHVQAVQLLLRLGADPNAEDENGWTPLDRGRLHPAIVSILERAPKKTAREEPARLKGKHGADKKTESRQGDRTHTDTLDETAQERRRWQQLGLLPFTTAEDGFSAWFPAKPERNEYGIITNYAAMVEGEAAYNVFVNEFPAPVLTDEAIDASLKGYLGGKVLVFGKNAPLARTQTITFLGRRALDYEYTLQAEGRNVYFRGVAFHEGKRLYCISVVCPVAEAKGTAYAKYRAFRDSFRLTGAR